MPNFGGFSSNGHSNFSNNGGRSGRSGGNGRFGGPGGPGDEPAEDEDHEHEYRPIIDTENLSAYDEIVHSVITLEFSDRGLALDLSYEEAEELGETLAAIVEYVRRKQVGEV